MKKTGTLLLILVLLAIPAQAAVFTYTDEASYLAKLAELGYGSIQEGFEDNTAWASAQSPSTTPTVLSQGITWSANNQATSSAEITTGSGATRTGSYGVYSIPHGDTSVTGLLDFKYDGWEGSSADTIYGVAGFVTGTSGAQLEVVIDGNVPGAYDFGPAGFITFSFFGVVDTDGFNTFEVRETEGKTEDQKYIFGDDFTIATGNTTVPPSPADTIAPIITLIGDAFVNVTQGTTYLDAGATAWDETDGNLTASIITTNDVDTSIINTFEVKYDVTDAAGNIATTVTREVNVVAAPPPADTTDPIITLLGDAVVFVTENDSYVDAGATATDDTDGNITPSIITVNPVDTSVPGNYTVTYDVTDSSGNAAVQVTRLVVVQSLPPPPPIDTTAPVITLLGDAIVNILEGSIYNDAGATASDDRDGDLTANITTVNLVDTSIPGPYTITYDVSDVAGNAATQITRTVNVEALPPPPGNETGNETPGNETPGDVPEEITVLIGLLEEKRDALAAAGEEEAADALDEIINWLSGLTTEDIKDLEVKTGKKKMVKVETENAEFKYEYKHVGHDKVKVEQGADDEKLHVKVTDGGFAAKLELEV